MLEEAIRQLSGDKERAVSMNCELLSENKALREAARAALKKQAGSEEHARLAALLENQPN